MKKILHLCAAALTVGLIAGCSGKKKTAGTEAEMPVDVAEAVTDSIVLHKTYPGYLSAPDYVDVVARVNGQLLTTNYNGGDSVAKGKVLFTIDDTKYRNAVSQAQAQLETARANLEYASSHYKAVKKALESDAVSQMEVNQAESAYHQAQADVQNATASLSNARTMLSYCTVRATLSGHITSSIYADGAYLNGEAAPVTLATIYDNSHLNALFNIEDEQYIQLLAGENSRDKVDLSKVPINFSEKMPHRYYGDLRYISPTVDKNTGTITLKARIQNPYGELKNGMYITVDLPYAIEPHAILVKDASVGTDQLGKYLYVVNDSNAVVYTPITVGEVVDDSMRVVLKGIAPGARYVTKALLKVRNGMKVKPVMTK
jgi:RND family efflux transporter, MFP subunit